jgi:hypothetical protein
MVNACTDDAALCEAKAALYTTAITTFDNPNYITSEDNEVPDNFSDTILSIVRDFNDNGAEGYLSVIKTLEETVTVASYDYGYMPTFYAGAGALYKYLDMNDEALLDYTYGLGLYGGTPLLLYLRAQLYAEMGELDLAAIDAFRFDLITADFPQARGDATLSADYPLDMSKLTEWRVYPVGSESISPGGLYITDRTLVESTPIRVGFYSDGKTLLRIDGEGDEMIVIALRQSEESVYGGGVPEYYGSMSVVVAGDLARGELYGEGFESSSRQTMIMAPANIPDPRLGYPRCEGGARWRLNIGGKGHAIDDFQPSPVYLEPGGELAEESFYEFTVVEGPVCIDGVAWWGVNLERNVPDDVVYWIEEAYGNPAGATFGYNVLLDNRPLSSCSDAMPANLYVGERGIVRTGLGANNVRSQPSLSDEIIGSLPEGAVFDVLDGPVCADDLIWWRIDHNALVGWTAGDNGEEYLLDRIFR